MFHLKFKYLIHLDEQKIGNYYQPTIIAYALGHYKLTVFIIPKTEEKFIQGQYVTD